MSRVVWIITVVDQNTKPWPAPHKLAGYGAQAPTIARYVRVRRTMTAAGLRKKLRDQQN